MFDEIKAYIPKKIHRLDLEIDEFTFCLKHTGTGEIYNTKVDLATNADFKHVEKWRMHEDWNLYLNQPSPFYSVHKVLLENDEAIQGMICLESEPLGTTYKWIEMSVIESAPHNYGQSKLYAGVAAHLLAIACQKSIETGCNGIVAFHAKNQKLVEHYQNKLGAVLIDADTSRMVIIPETAIKLVNIYFNKE